MIYQHTVSQSGWKYIFFAGLLAGIVLRILLARNIHTPGQWDAAFYFTVAKNIVEGRGLVIDYVWHFLNGPAPLTHYSSDFWHPLASILMALPMRLFGISVSNALISSILAGVGIALIVFALGKLYGLPEDTRAMAALLSFFAPYSIQTSLATDSIIYFAVAALLTLYFTIRGRNAPVYFLVAAIFSGLGHLTRQDGILLIGTILICIAAAPQPLQKKFLMAACAIAIHLIVLSPLLIKNYAVMHSFFPPGPPMTRFLTEHDDVYAFGETFTFQTYWQEFGLQGILQNKFETAYFHVLQAFSVLSPIVAVLIITSLVDIHFIRKDRQRLLFFFPVFVYGGLTYFFYIFVASFALFSAQKSLVTVMSFASILIMDHAARRLRYKPMVMGIWFGMLLYLGILGLARTSSIHASYNATYANMRATQAIILRDAGQRGLQPAEIIVMTHNPWHYHEATGWPTVMIPNNDLETIFEVADSYRVSYMLLPAPRAALQSIDNGEANPRLSLVGSQGELDIYRIVRDP